MNSIIVQWFLNTFDSSIIVSIPYMTDAKDLWHHLMKRFFTENRPRIYELMEEIENCKQNAASIFDYYGQFTHLWEEFDNYGPKTDCCCEGVTCNWMTESACHHEKLKLHKFLLGLENSLFRIIISQIINMNLLPSVESAYSKVIREKRHCLVVALIPSYSDVAFATRSNKIFSFLFKLRKNIP